LEISSEQILSTDIQVVKEINCSTVSTHDLKMIEKKLEFTSRKSSTLHGVCVWFDVTFEVSFHSVIKITKHKSNANVLHNGNVLGKQQDSVAEYCPWKTKDTLVANMHLPF
jgi:hypothetical protein